MRWDHLRLDATGDTAGPSGWTVPPLIEREAVARTFDTPEFRGMTFYEVHARSIVSEVPRSSRMMFRYTVNPYRGCQHRCVYCFARNTHTYLDLNAGQDFDTRVGRGTAAARPAVRHREGAPHRPGAAGHEQLSLL